MDEVRARFEAVVGNSFALSRQESRWLALGDEFVAFAADDEAGWRRFRQEAWLLERWRAAGVPVPRVIGEDAARRVQVRERMHGLTGHGIEERIFAGAKPDEHARVGDVPLSPFGERLATSYGDIARRIRGAVSVAEATAAGIGPSWRRSVDLEAALALFHETDAPPSAKAKAAASRAWITALRPADAVVHADMHLWNLCFAEDGTIIGVFDLDLAGLDYAAQELLYIHAFGSRFVARTLDAYGAIELETVRHAHVREAVGHLLFHGPGTERHPSIVRWVTAALDAFAP